MLAGQNASVAMVSGMVVEEMNSQQMRQQIAAAGYPTFYNMLMTNTGESRFPSYTSPTLHICVSSTSQQAVIGTNAMASQKFITLTGRHAVARHVQVKSRIAVTRLAQAVPEAIIGRPSRPTSVCAGRGAGRGGAGAMERPGAHPLAAAPQTPRGRGQLASRRPADQPKRARTPGPVRARCGPAHRGQACGCISDHCQSDQYASGIDKVIDRFDREVLDPLPVHVAEPEYQLPVLGGRSAFRPVQAAEMEPGKAPGYYGVNINESLGAQFSLVEWDR